MTRDDGLDEQFRLFPMIPDDEDIPFEAITMARLLAARDRARVLRRPWLTATASAGRPKIGPVEAPNGHALVWNRKDSPS